MTIQELAETLPNGFHDAHVSCLKIDYARREVAFEMSVWVGEVDSPDLAVRECHRPAVLKLTGLLYCVIEPPDTRYPYLDARDLTIDIGDLGLLPAPGPSNLPSVTLDGAFRSWIFVNQWNAFIYVAACKACLTWRNEPGSDETI